MDPYKNDDNNGQTPKKMITQGSDPRKMAPQELFLKYLFLKGQNLTKSLVIDLGFTKETAELVYMDRECNILVLTNYKTFSLIHQKMKDIFNSIDFKVL
jgi:hypothetical protein